jgi:hypothetical protein
MRVETSNLVFDGSDKRCGIIFSYAQGQNFAFIQCFDPNQKKDSIHSRKEYWGRWDWDNPESSMLHILESGGKWPELPDI